MPRVSTLYKTLRLLRNIPCRRFLEPMLKLLWRVSEVPRNVFEWSRIRIGEQHIIHGRKVNVASSHHVQVKRLCCSQYSKVE